MASINSEKVLAFLKSQYGHEVTKQEIADTIGVSLSAVNGSVNGLARKNLIAERCEDVEIEPATETRKAKMKTVRYIQLNEDGLAFDIEAHEAEQKAKREAKRAADREAKKAAKAAMADAE